MGGQTKFSQFSISEVLKTNRYRKLTTPCDLTPATAMWAFNEMGYSGPEFLGGILHYSQEYQRYVDTLSSLFKGLVLVLDPTLNDGEWFVRWDGQAVGSEGA